MQPLLRTVPFECRVSSVLNRDANQYGKKFLFDDKEDTCWTSDQGSPQWVAVSFESVQEFTGFSIQFQGGFVGSDCYIFAESGTNSFENIQPFYPEDSNSVQTFGLEKTVTSKRLKFVFNKSTDFFGRIVIYKLEIIGTQLLV